MNAKFRIYKKNKADKVEKYRKKAQAHYDANHVPGTPHIICCPVVTHDDKYAVPLLVEGYPENDGDDGMVDTIDQPPVEIEDKKKIK